MTSSLRVDEDEKLIYTPAYYAALEKLLDAHHVHRCTRCGTADGVRPSGSKSAAKVRLALRDVSKPANDVTNVGLFCQKCRRPLPEWRTARKVKPSTLPQLF